MLGLGIANKIGLGKLARKLIMAKAKRQHLQFLNNNKKIVAQRNKQKIFVIGFNKTGTTTLEKTLLEFDYIVGHQRTAELLFDDISSNNYNSLIDYCKTAEAFQDVPFSFPHVYKTIDHYYPNSKFILTVRDSGEQWFNSLVNFHSKIWGNGSIPTEKELANVNYVYKGYPLDTIKFIYGPNLYEKEHYINVYQKHNQEVLAYFKNRPNDFICLNVNENEDYQKLCGFLKITSNKKSFYWENKTNCE